MPQPYSNVVSYSHTAADDLIFKMISTDLWLSNANIHIVTNGAYYGDVNLQVAHGNATDILVFDDFNLANLYFRNYGAGLNTTIYVVGIVMPKKRMIEMGVK